MDVIWDYLFQFGIFTVLSCFGQSPVELAMMQWTNFFLPLRHLQSGVDNFRRSSEEKSPRVLTDVFAAAASFFTTATEQQYHLQPPGGNERKFSVASWFHPVSGWKESQNWRAGAGVYDISSLTEFPKTSTCRSSPTDPSADILGKTRLNSKRS